MYSFGMVLYEMFSGKVPFEEMDDDQVKITNIRLLVRDHLQFFFHLNR